jgi:opacity protein-like surface antigen
MKKIWWGVLSVLLLSVVCQWGWAQDTSKFNLAVGTGIALPIGEFADVYNLGFHIGGTFDVKVAKNILLFGDLRYSSFSAGTEGWGFPSNATIKGGTFMPFSIFAGAKYIFLPPPSKINVYGCAGIGLCMLSTSDLTAHYIIHTTWYTADVTSTTQFKSETDFALLFGGGAVYQLSPKLGLFGEIRYVSIFSEGESTQFIPIILGVLIRL